MSDNKNIQQKKQVTGKLLFFGGVYSNLQSLQALKFWADENGFAPQNIFCTGDIVGYCAQPIESINLIKEWRIHSIAGNVEIQLRNNDEDCGCDFSTGGRCDIFSRNWYNYAQSKMNKEAIDWLQTLPENIQFDFGHHRISIVHGSWFQTSEFIFQSTPWETKADNFKASKSDVIIAGHCGLPFADVHDNLYWLNAGVIGMPANDGTSRVWFMTLELDSTGQLMYMFHTLEYDYETSANLMLQNGLPASYAKTLSTGIWDNCEILPAPETKAQGIKIELGNVK